MQYMQKIFFGPPGCGKSYRVRQEARVLKVVEEGDDPEKCPNMIRTVFHPEYGYGDFVAKLLPQTDADGKIKYNIHTGPLIKALARAYADSDQSVLLVIDEINRGNCAQIFGDVFQLLDRDDSGKSEYGINPSDLIRTSLQQELSKVVDARTKDMEVTVGQNMDYEDEIRKNFAPKLERLKEALQEVDDANYKLRLPPNLSLIGTMNTSDESVYYMDTAFKRRWDFDYMKWDGYDVPALHKNAMIEGTEYAWQGFLEKLNDFIAHEFNGRSVDDKQVGIWFLKLPDMGFYVGLEELKNKLEQLKGKSKKEEWDAHFEGLKEVDGIPAYNHPGNLKTYSVKQPLKDQYKIDCPELYSVKSNPEKLAEILLNHIGENYWRGITRAAIQNKLMFFLWDNVFSRSREPLYGLLEKGGAKEVKPRTFGAFSDEVRAFIEGLMKWDHDGHKWTE